MASALTKQQHRVLAVAAKSDVVAPYSHAVLTQLEQLKLVAAGYLRQPNGRLALSARWTITDAGRRAIEAAQ